MSYSLLVVFIFVILAFMAMYMMYLPRCNEYSNSLSFKMNMLAFPYIYFIYALGATGAYFSLANNDFVEDLTLHRFLLPLLLSAIIYGASLIFYTFSFSIVVIACIAATVWIQPIGVGNVFPDIPVWAFRLLLVVLFSVYCLGIKILNMLPHTFIVPQSIVCVGLIFLGIIGAAPLYTSACAGLLLGTMCAYMIMNYYSVKIDLDDGACVGITYLISSLLLMNVGEFNFVSCIMFTLVFWAELTVAVFNKFMGERRQNLAENTNYYLAAEKYNVTLLTTGMIKIGLVVCLLAWFQLFSVNMYSLIIVSGIITIWLNGSIGKPFRGLRSIKDINKEFVSDLKKNIEDTKNIFNQKDKQ